MHTTTHQNVKALALDDGDRVTFAGKEYVCVQACAWHDRSLATLRPCDAPIGHALDDIKIPCDANVTWHQEHDRELARMAFDDSADDDVEELRMTQALLCDDDDDAWRNAVALASTAPRRNMQANNIRFAD